jgi:hypothetical protein
MCEVALAFTEAIVMAGVKTNFLLFLLLILRAYMPIEKD